MRKRDRHSLVGCAFSEEAGKRDGYEEHATVQTVTKNIVDSVLLQYATIAEACLRTNGRPDWSRDEDLEYLPACHSIILAPAWNSIPRLSHEE